jgi:hypothetical protein
MGCSSANPAVARFALDEGCLAKPDDRQQDLCLHHAMRSTPCGTIELLEVYERSPFVLGILARRYELMRLIVLMTMLAGCASVPDRIEVMSRGTHPICRGAGHPATENVLLWCEDGRTVIMPWSRVERTGPRSGVVDL